MTISIFDLFKIGIGPSSSHTMGPMNAGNHFIELLQKKEKWEPAAKIIVDLYGSLALTGLGHRTDQAIMLGLRGERPHTIDPENIPIFCQEISRKKSISLAKSKKNFLFDPKQQILFHTQESLPLHENGMKFTLVDKDEKVLLSQIYYSIGGGFIKRPEDFSSAPPKNSSNIPYPFDSCKELIEITKAENLQISDIVLKNECTFYKKAEIFKKIDAIWQAMNQCIERGCQQSGVLPGILKVQRRAKSIYTALTKNPEKNTLDPLIILDWVNLYALAVNEENASGSRVVTAPTNGAAGIIPAVIRYYLRFCPGSQAQGIRKFLLTAAAIGSLYAKNASISGAAVGCQGEVGVASSMAAAGLTAALNGSAKKIEQAAEIAMEHSLGLTCDPIAGLVQIPCIERNAMGAVKAINASRITMREDRDHFVSLDTVIKTMKQTGEDMKKQYKETSIGGLAANVIFC